MHPPCAPAAATQSLVTAPAAVHGAWERKTASAAADNAMQQVQTARSSVRWQTTWVVSSGMLGISGSSQETVGGHVMYCEAAVLSHTYHMPWQ